MLSQKLTDFLLWLLSLLTPLEEIVGRSVKREAIKLVRREAEEAIAFAQAQAAAEIERQVARLEATIAAPHVVTPEGAAGLVAAAAISATVTPQGDNYLVAPVAQ